MVSAADSGDFAPRIPQRRSWDRGYVQRWLWRREQIILAIAKAYCLRDAKAHMKMEAVRPFLPEELLFEVGPTPCQMLCVGAPRAAMKRVRMGNLGIEDQIKPWTAEFFQGLKLAGALSQKEPGRFRIDAKSHPELVVDISEWKIAGSLGNDDGFGRRRLVGCLPATYLPVQDPASASVIAGIFAGARLSSVAEENWLEVPDVDEVKKVLQSWTILNHPSRDIRRRSHIRVSPFFAALFTELMPQHSQKRILGIRDPALSPDLALLYWEWMFRPVKRGMRILPFADALPFGCSRRTFYRRGWRRKELHRIAVQEYGIVGVDSRLGARLRGWFESHKAARGEVAALQNGAFPDPQETAKWHK